MTEVRSGLAEVYPCTIFPARYGGAYEGAPWIAVDIHADSVYVSYALGDDNECSHFFSSQGARFWGVTIGRGNTPNEAYNDLKSQLD